MSTSQPRPWEHEKDLCRGLPTPAADHAGNSGADGVADDRSVVVDGLRLHYLRWGCGNGMPIVFLHGGGLNAHTWDEVCGAVHDRQPCYAIDQRGHGDSDWSATLDYTLDAYVHDLEGFVERVVRSRLVLVGQSLGAIVAVRYAARHPELVAAMVAVDAGPFARSQAGIDRVTAFTLDREHFATLEEAVEYAAAFNPRRDPQLLRRSLSHSMRRLPDGQWTWKRDRRHLNPQFYADLVRTLRSLVPECPKIECPTLVVRGADSDAFSEDEAAQFASLLSDGRSVTVTDSGHNVQGDNPDGLVNVLVSFLAAHDETVIGYLTDLGAHGLSHPGGTLLDHLRRTADLLARWGARPALVSAGLCHAVYGTDGFEIRLRTLDQRRQVAHTIGQQAETIVYRYASCDRKTLYGSVTAEGIPLRDRFTGQTRLLSETEGADLLELTFANEIDIARHNPAFARNDWQQLTNALDRCRAHVSALAWADYQHLTSGPWAMLSGFAAQQPVEPRRESRGEQVW